MNYRICLKLFCGMLLLPTLLTSQSRDLHAERIVIDDNATDGALHRMTIQTPGSLPQDVILTIPDPGAGTAEFMLVSPGSGGVWYLGGNMGTTPGTNFLGTTDLTRLHLYVDSGRANSMILDTNGSLQRGVGGDLRGTNAVDLQLDRLSPTQVASGIYSAIGGGRSNTASGERATIGGGFGNIASARYSSIGGGESNTGSGTLSAIAGGGSNIASGIGSVIGGGRSNTASGGLATIGGGFGNIASVANSSIGGGESNTGSGYLSAIGGGRENTASGENATIAGGAENVASGYGSAIGGGTSNTALGTNAVVTGGAQCEATNSGSMVGGGLLNQATGWYSVVGGGTSNLTEGNRSTVGGGDENAALGDYATVPGGRGLILSTTADGSFGFNGGATYMTISAPNVAVFANTDMWLANNNNSASELRFYEPKSGAGNFPNGANYTAFQAQAQASDITYTLPAALPPAQNGATGDLGGGVLLTNSSGALVWEEGAIVTATINFLNTVNSGTDDQTITVTGAVVGDFVSLGIPNAAQPAGMAWYQAWVSAANTVTVRFYNLTGVALDPDGVAGASFSVAVSRP